jgi:hypothetical protein
LNADRMTKGIAIYSTPEELPPDSQGSERLFADAAFAATNLTNR